MRHPLETPLAGEVDEIMHEAMASAAAANGVGEEQEMADAQPFPDTGGSIATATLDGASDSNSRNDKKAPDASCYNEDHHLHEPTGSDLLEDCLSVVPEEEEIEVPPLRQGRASKMRVLVEGTQPVQGRSLASLILLNKAAKKRKTS